MKSKVYITCCLGCEERVVGCHSTCKEYIEQKAFHEERMREQKKAIGLERSLIGLTTDGYWKGGK